MMAMKVQLCDRRRTTPTLSAAAPPSDHRGHQHVRALEGCERGGDGREHQRENQGQAAVPYHRHRECHEGDRQHFGRKDGDPGNDHGRHEVGGQQKGQKQHPAQVGVDFGAIGPKHDPEHPQQQQLQQIDAQGGQKPRGARAQEPQRAKLLLVGAQADEVFRGDLLVGAQDCLPRQHVRARRGHGLPGGRAAGHRGLLVGHVAELAKADEKQTQDLRRLRRSIGGQQFRGAVVEVGGGEQLPRGHEALALSPQHCDAVSQEVAGGRVDHPLGDELAGGPQRGPVDRLAHGGVAQHLHERRRGGDVLGRQHGLELTGIPPQRLLDGSEEAVERARGRVARLRTVAVDHRRRGDRSRAVALEFGLRLGDREPGLRDEVFGREHSGLVAAEVGHPRIGRKPRRQDQGEPGQQHHPRAVVHGTLRPAALRRARQHAPEVHYSSPSSDSFSYARMMCLTSRCRMTSTASRYTSAMPSTSRRIRST